MQAEWDLLAVKSLAGFCSDMHVLQAQSCFDQSGGLYDIGCPIRTEMTCVRVLVARRRVGALRRPVDDEQKKEYLALCEILGILEKDCTSQKLKIIDRRKGEKGNENRYDIRKKKKEQNS